MKRLLHNTCILFAALASTPSLAITAPPSKVATLSWEITEHVLRLGITPVAVADAPDYRSWVVRPTLPPQVPNLGTRTEPNLELLAQLKPDLIVITPLLEDIRANLERIAPVLTYGDFTQEQDNLHMQRENFLDLASRLGRSAEAKRQLQSMETRITTLRTQLDNHFQGSLPQVTTVRFVSPVAVMINGPNSMPDHAMNLLGLRPALAVPVSRWGNIQVPVTALGQVRRGAVLYLEPFPQQERLFTTRLWQQMPFIRAQRFAAMRSTWTHGGVFCVEYLAEAISEALLQLPGADQAPSKASVSTSR